MFQDNFLEDLLVEAEQKEESQRQAYYDLVLLEMSKLQQQISNNFEQAEKEVQIIKEWTLNKNSILQDKTSFYEKKLEAYIRELEVKTIDMPHGTLKFHKKPDKVEISDMNLFLKNAKPEMLTAVPEQLKPDLNKIKVYIKEKGRVPEGITLVEGRQEFSYKLNKGEI